MNAIPRETACGLCQEIRQENRGKWYTVGGLWCWGCSTFSRGNPDKLRFASSPDSRGCGQVNARFDALPKTAVATVAVAEVREVAAEPERVDELPSIIYLPPARQAPLRSKRTCADCGRQFRIAAGQPEAEYCPTCDYRRKRGQLIQQDTDSDSEEPQAAE